jgi:hypothetical protein
LWREKKNREVEEERKGSWVRNRGKVEAAGGK